MPLCIDQSELLLLSLGIRHRWKSDGKHQLSPEPGAAGVITSPSGANQDSQTPPLETQPRLLFPRDMHSPRAQGHPSSALSGSILPGSPPPPHGAPPST